MATRLPDTVRSAGADAMVDLLDAGAGAATIEIRTGSQPADADDAATGSLLVTITLNDPAFGSASAGVKTMDNTPVPSGVAVASGTAGWFRAKDSNGNTVVDGAVGVTGSGVELELASTTISSGQTVSITSGTATQPAST